MADDIAVNAPHPSDAIGLSERLKAALKAIDNGRSQADILNAMLVQCLGYGSRAALLIWLAASFMGCSAALFITSRTSRATCFSSVFGERFSSIRSPIESSFDAICLD